MTYCNEHGIPHSQFLSWSPEDRAKALAFLIESNERCALCGTAAWEWEEDRRAYEPVEHHCPGCYLKHVAGEAAGEMPGTTVRLVATNSQMAAQRLLEERRRYEARYAVEEE